jgi:hypothetical protein
MVSSTQNYSISPSILVVKIAASLIFILLLNTCRSPVTKETAVKHSNPGIGDTYDPPPVRTYPSNPAIIQGWIDKMDFPKLRAHAWDIWESINTNVSNHQTLPIWETWYSGYEVYVLGKDAATHRANVKDFEFPAQFVHLHNSGSRIPVDPAERATAFNRYSRSLAQTIWDKGYHKKATLERITQEFDAKGTPVADREISTSVDAVDALSFAIKPVFQFIEGDTPSAVPYWSGVSPQATRDLFNPEPHTWNQCVVVDPTGTLQPGTSYSMPCNGQPGDWQVVSLDDFYTIEITQEMVDSFSQMARGSGDDVGAHNITDTSAISKNLKAGNYALLMAMHVTGKEIVDWTWQTYWWSDEPDNPPFGSDRPSTIPKPWNNYQMRTAYFMVMPPGQRQGGTPLHSFNPYLETNLRGYFRISPMDSIRWTGVFSNCMSCHRLAAFPDNQYAPDGFIDKGDAFLFGGKTKVDFLWSVLRAQ